MVVIGTLVLLLLFVLFVLRLFVWGFVVVVVALAFCCVVFVVCILLSSFDWYCLFSLLASVIVG